MQLTHKYYLDHANYNSMPSQAVKQYDAASPASIQPAIELMFIRNTTPSSVLCNTLQHVSVQH